MEEIGQFLGGDFGLSSEEMKNSSEVSFHSSEVFFHSSEVFFASSLDIFHLLVSYWEIPR